MWIWVACAAVPRTGLTNETCLEHAPLGKVERANLIRLFPVRKGKLILKVLNTVYIWERPVTLKRTSFREIQLFWPICPVTMTLPAPDPTLITGDVRLEHRTVLTRVLAKP